MLWSFTWFVLVLLDSTPLVPPDHAEQLAAAERGALPILVAPALVLGLLFGSRWWQVALLALGALPVVWLLAIPVFSGWPLSPDAIREARDVILLPEYGALVVGALARRVLRFARNRLGTDV